MDITTSYLGMQLKSPLVVSASPLSEELDKIRLMEDHGAAAVVLYSLFEEQIRLEAHELHHHTTMGAESFAEALSYFPEPQEYRAGPGEYLEHIRKAKAAVDIPIIASLNGATPGGWTAFAKEMESAGADALELNIYSIPTDVDLSGAEVEAAYLDIVSAVRRTVSIPVAVKLSPYFSNLAHMAKQLAMAGANGLVLFNRFYQPDIDLEALEVEANIILSRSSAMRLPMRWIAILKDRVDVDFAATSGIQRGEDVLKMLMVGANVTMLCSALLKHGIPYLGIMERKMVEWMQEHEYESVRQMQGSMSQHKVNAPAEFERGQYMKALTHHNFYNG